MYVGQSSKMTVHVTQVGGVGSLGIPGRPPTVSASTATATTDTLSKYYPSTLLFSIPLFSSYLH